jgi:hypothetical protein
MENEFIVLFCKIFTDQGDLRHVLDDPSCLCQCLCRLLG